MNSDTWLDQLHAPGWAVISDFLDLETCNKLRAEATLLLDTGKMQQAGVGRGQGFAVRKETRSDLIYTNPCHQAGNKTPPIISVT